MGLGPVLFPDHPNWQKTVCWSIFPNLKNMITLQSMLTLHTDIQDEVHTILDNSLKPPDFDTYIDEETKVDAIFLRKLFKFP